MNDTPAACCAAGAVSSWASPTTIRSPGIARMLAGQGADLAFTYQGEAFGRRVAPLAASVGSQLVLSCDVEHPKTVDEVFAALREPGAARLPVHAIAYSDRAELKGRYADTSRENFIRTMVISCFSFTEVARRAAALMDRGGSLLTLTYGGSVRVVPNYNVMGVAKAALESSVRYLAADWGCRPSGSMPSRPDRCAPSPVPASPMPGRCTISRSATAAAAHHHPRRGRRRRGVPAVGSRDRRHRRGASCRSRLPHHLDPRPEDLRGQGLENGED